MLIPIKLLMIEDSADDEMLAIRTLKKNGYDPEVERVQTAEDMTLALAQQDWDIILCDFHMPGFSGVDAIELLQKSKQDIPLIIVSGAIGEETAMECIHRGASDYIMKGKPNRLGVAVRREMEKSELRKRRKKDEESLRQSEEKYRNILESMVDGYYETDIAGNFIFFNPALCRMWGYPKEELLGMNSRQYTDAETAKRLYHAHNTVYKTGQPGRLLDYEIIRKDGTILNAQQSVTLLKDSQGKAIGFRGIVRDVCELKQMEKERQENLKQLRKSLEATIHAMAVTVESRDPYTAGHQRRVAQLAHAISLEMNLDKHRVDGLLMAGTIHDLGKISIPAEILTKPTKLTPIEFEIIKTHAQAGYDILKDIDFPWPIARIVLEHHERINGSGYPNRFKGDDLLLESKILTVADVVEAMASYRPYRPALGIDLALDEIIKNKGILYDEDIVNICLKLFKEKNFSFAA